MLSRACLQTGTDSITECAVLLSSAAGCRSHQAPAGCRHAAGRAAYPEAPPALPVLQHSLSALLLLCGQCEGSPLHGRLLHYEMSPTPCRLQLQLAALLQLCARCAEQRAQHSCLAGFQLTDDIHTCLSCRAGCSSSWMPFWPPVHSRQSSEPRSPHASLGWPTSTVATQPSTSRTR